ncbi:MAG: AAA family ATPase [Acidobacterium ailaaui]|nr:AAA family ATPase [Pseudacidobacterium ailaaui]
MFLNKVIENNDVAALDRFNITESDMPTQAEKEAYRFIVDYAERNHGQAPSWATFAEACNVEYLPQISDSYEYLANEIKGQSAKIRLYEYINGQFAEKFGVEKDGRKLLEDLLKSVESIKMGTNVRNKIGTDVKNDTDKFLAEYDRRKRGESFRTWKSKFSIIGEYISSNVYVVFGKSGRGKSVITLEEGIEAAMQGANVLIWALEMGWFEVMVRIYVSVSARRGLMTTNVGGLDLSAGFDSSELRKGQLADEFEIAFKAFLAELNDFIPGNIIVRAVDDDDFSSRNLRALEADIKATNADVVILDPFYYLDYEKNTSKTAGGDAAETSKKLRRLAGRTQTVIFAITQAEETKEEKDEDGNRELKLPERENVTKTKQLLQDAYQLIAVDTDYKQGRGLVGINKGRDGGEGEVTEILYIPQVGIVKEMEVGEAIADQFTEVF